MGQCFFQGAFCVNLIASIQFSTKCSLFILAVRPVTSVTPEVLTVEDGAEATISCHVTGLPLPSIVWRDSENRIISGSTQGK